MPRSRTSVARPRPREDRWTASTRKRAIVELGLCARHREQRRKAYILGWGGCCALFAVMNVAALTASWSLFRWALVGMLPVCIVAYVRVRVAAVAKIDERRVWLHVGQPFLESVRAPRGPGRGR